MKIKGIKLYKLDRSSKFIDFFDKINKFEQNWNAFQSDNRKESLYLSQNRLNEIDEFNRTFYGNYSKIIESLSKMIVEIRRGEKEESVLKKLYEQVKHLKELDIENLLLYKNWDNYKDIRINLKEIVPNLEELNKTNDFENYLHSNKDKDIIVFTFDDGFCGNNDGIYKNYYVLRDIMKNMNRFGNNISFVAFNYEIYDRLAKHLVNRREKCVICLFSKSRLIAYDLKQFYENRKLIEEKVNQIRDKIGKYDIENVS